MKILNAKKLAIASVLGSALLVSTQVNAALVQFSVDGQITSASSTAFGLSVGDTITASGVFDDSIYTSETPTSIYYDFSSAINNMTISVGNTVFTDNMEQLGGAYLYFSNGAFNGIDYSATDGSFDSWGYLDQIVNGVLVEDFTGVNANGSTIGGFWGEMQITPVPVPAAVWLFSSGLLLLGGISKKNRKKAL